MDEPQHSLGIPGRLGRMDLDDVDQLDLAYLLIFGHHPDLSVAGDRLDPCTTPTSCS